MKKIILSLIFCFGSLFGTDWQNYNDAKKIQQKNSKIIMMYVKRTNCRYCINMQKDVFDDNEMSQWIKERFIPVMLNLDTNILPLSVNVSMTPSFYFINKNQEIIKTIPGSWNIDDFKLLTKNIKEL